MVTIVNCAHPGCANLFHRVKAQRYCAVGCRVADRKCCRCRARIATDQPGTKNTYCRSCQAELARLRRGTPAERARVMNVYRLKRFGITPEQYLAMLEAQSGLCALCRQPETALDNRSKDVRALAIDHDHVSGAVRALLCQRCNTGLGGMRDDPELLRAAADYIESHQRKVAA